MKIFISFFILFIAISTLSYAGKLQMEGSQFDLSAASTTTCKNKTGNIHGFIEREMGWSYGGFDIPISGAKVTLDDLHRNFSDSTETNSDGYFKFCDLETSYYLVTANKKGYDTAKYVLPFQRREKGLNYNYYPPEDASMQLYKKGKSPEKNSKITCSLIAIREDIENIKVTLKGMQTKYKVNLTTDTGLISEFDDLKADTYLLTAKKGRKTKTKRIKLEKNMIYQFYIQW